MQPVITACPATFELDHPRIDRICCSRKIRPSQRLVLKHCFHCCTTHRHGPDAAEDDARLLAFAIGIQVQVNANRYDREVPVSPRDLKEGMARRWLP